MAAVNQRYARALAAVVDEQKLDAAATEKQIGEFLAAFESSQELREVLGDPSIPESQKLSLLDALAGKLGMSKTVRNFIAVLTHHGRLSALGEILADYTSLADAEANVAEVEVVSALELDAASRTTLEQEIAKLVAGRKVSASYSQDAALLGGAVVKIGSTVYDGSVRGQLRQMKQRLMAATA